MDINELRAQVNSEQIEKWDPWQVLVGLLLAIALVSSLATPFVAHPEWTALSAVLFLTLGLLCDRALGRRRLYTPSVRRS